MTVAFGVPSAEQVTITAGIPFVQHAADFLWQSRRRHLAPRIGWRRDPAARARAWRLHEDLVDFDFDGETRSRNGWSHQGRPAARRRRAAP